MYAKHFGLIQDPFSIAPDPHYLFMSERHREALAHLLFGLGEKSGAGGGFVLLSGEIGTGKTTVCRCFLEQIPATCRVAYIFNPKLTVLELLQTVCEEFHVTVPIGASTAKDYIDPLNTFLLEGHGAGLNNLLIIDEAQNLSPDVLEQLRLLTNLETNERKLLQIVLIGQPELRTMLARPDLEQLAQRIVARFHLNSLNPGETQAYMAHRLGVAGWTGELPFEAKAVAAIHRITGGVPRRINLLCGRAMLGAYAQGTKRVTVGTVKAASAEVFETQSLSRASANKWLTRSLSWLQSRGALHAVAMGALPALALVGAAWWIVNGGARHSLPLAPSLTLSTSLAMPLDGANAAASLAASQARGSSAFQAQLAATLPQSPMDLLAAMKAAPPGAASAWRELGQLWLGAPIDENANPCKGGEVRPEAQSASGTGSLACFAAAKAKLPLLMQLSRPGILTLQDANGQRAYALLLALSADRVTLALAGGTYNVPVAVLQNLWNGDFATLWRTPPGYSGELALETPSPALDWLAQRLALIASKTNPISVDANPVEVANRLRRQLRSFQRSQGLTIDGRPGALTLMQLNRETGVVEPRLITP